MVERTIELIMACRPTIYLIIHIPFSNKPFGMQMNMKLMPLFKDKMSYFCKSPIAIENRQGDIDQKIPFNLVLI